jgi:molybdopterin molybdotransferase
MARLADDCFAHGGAPMTVAAAEAALCARLAPRGGEEWAPLEAALGRVLARPLRAATPLPPFAQSAVDGYAFRHADLSPDAATRLALAGRIPAGGAGAPLGPGEAARIFTGAPLPAGADTVMMQEDAQAEPGVVCLPAGLAAGANRRAAGEELPAGAEALPAGLHLHAGAIGLAAALGAAQLPLRPRLRVGVLSTGDELAGPGVVLGPAQTHDANRPLLCALLARLPAAVSDLGILRDDAALTARALAAAAAGQDLLITTGGVAEGEADHLRAALPGAALWRLALKPGRAVTLGVAAGTPVLGLPGNPAAALAAFLHLARPLILHLAGAAPAPLPRLAARAGFAFDKRPGRREHLVVRLAGEEAVLVGPLRLAALAAGDALAELGEEVTAIRPGDPLPLLPFAAIF